MHRITGWLVALTRFGVGLSFAVLIISVLIQVIGRATGNSPVWTEELTRYALLYLAAFGAGLSLRTGDLVNVDVICAGAYIRPGDIIVADDDGVWVVKRENAEEVLKKAQDREANEEEKRQKLANGELGLDMYGFREKLVAMGLKWV